MAIEALIDKTALFNEAIVSKSESLPQPTIDFYKVAAKSNKWHLTEKNKIPFTVLQEWK